MIPWRAGKPSPVLCAVLSGAVVFFGMVPQARGQGLLEAEVRRRAADAVTARAALEAGDAAYEKGDFGEAVAQYGKARELLAPSPKTAALREAATRRYAQAAVEHGKRLAKGGRLKEARGLIDGVLAREVAPDDEGAVRLREQLDDPLRYEQALDKGHAKEVDRVRRLLYMAESAYNTGKYDGAMKAYEEVIRLDPYNRAARRGMERVSEEKARYYKSAYDETRARVLAKVDAGWEDVRHRNVIDEVLAVPGEEVAVVGQPQGDRAVIEKLRMMEVDQVDFAKATLQEAVDFLREKSEKLDPGREGVNFLIDMGSGDSEEAKEIMARRFDLRIRSVPMSVVLQKVAEATGTGYEVEEYAVVFRPLGLETGALQTRRFRVPPDFLSREAVGRQNEGRDPFAVDEAGERGEVLTRLLSAEELLKKNGVSFPEGAFASYIPKGNILMVRNTRKNLAQVEQLVRLMTVEEPVQVAVRVTIIDVLEDRLRELGYDWLISPVPTGSRFTVGGGTQGNAGAIGAIPFGVLGGRDPITAGNRSGSQATAVDSIEGAMNRARPRVDRMSRFFDSKGNDLQNRITPGQTDSASFKRAPGSLSITGFLNKAAYQGLLRGMNRKKGVDLMTKPEVITRPGQRASVENIREMIYPSEYEPPEIASKVGEVFIDLGTGETALGFGGSMVPAHPTAFERAKIGTVLEVEPIVDREKGIINLRLAPVIKEFEGFINYGTPFGQAMQIVYDPDQVIPGLAPPPDPPGNPFGASWVIEALSAEQPNDILMPVFKTVKLDTNVNIYSGATVVLGGLLSQDIHKVRDKTPILGSLPYIGRFFQNEQDIPVRRAVVILVNAEILDPTGQRLGGGVE